MAPRNDTRPPLPTPMRYRGVEYSQNLARPNISHPTRSLFSQPQPRRSASGHIIPTGPSQLDVIQIIYHSDSTSDLVGVPLQRPILPIHPLPPRVMIASPRNLLANPTWGSSSSTSLSHLHSHPDTDSPAPALVLKSSLKSSLKKANSATSISQTTTASTKKVSFDTPMKLSELALDPKSRKKARTKRSLMKIPTQGVVGGSQPMNKWPYSQQDLDAYWGPPAFTLAFSNCSSSISMPTLDFNSRDIASMCWTEVSQEETDTVLSYTGRRRRTKPERNEAKKREKQLRCEKRGIWTVPPGVDGDYETLCLDDSEDEDEWDLGVREEKTETERIVDRAVEAVIAGLAKRDEEMKVSVVARTITLPTPVLITGKEKDLVKVVDVPLTAALTEGGERGKRKLLSKGVVKEVAKEAGYSRWWEIKGKKEAKKENETKNGESAKGKEYGNADDGNERSGGGILGGLIMPSMPKRTYSWGSR